MPSLNAHGVGVASADGPAMAMEREGLGKLPKTHGGLGLGSSAGVGVSELLLFNSSHTPFKAYNHIGVDNLAKGDERKGAGAADQDVAKTLANAPDSIGKGLVLPDVIDVDYTYVPSGSSVSEATDGMAFPKVNTVTPNDS